MSDPIITAQTAHTIAHGTECRWESHTPEYRAQVIANAREWDGSLSATPVAAIVLPTVDDAARTLWVADPFPGDLTEPGRWHRAAAQALLDLIAERVPVWQPVEPGTVIKAGTRWRTEGEGFVQEFVSSVDRPAPCGAATFIDPRTVPAEPEDPRLAVVVEWSNEPAATTREEAARDLLARLDKLEGDR